MSRHDQAFFIGDDRLNKAEPIDGTSQPLELGGRMLARVRGVWPERSVLDDFNVGVVSQVHRTLLGEREPSSYRC
jgi:hypothetical protein